MIRICAACVLLAGCSSATTGTTTVKAVWPMSAAATKTTATAGPGYTAFGRVADQAGSVAEGLVR